MNFKIGRPYILNLLAVITTALLILVGGILLSQYLEIFRGRTAIGGEWLVLLFFAPCIYKSIYNGLIDYLVEEYKKYNS